MVEKTPWKGAMDLHQALHAPARIAILLFLMPRSTTTFSIIQKALQVTAGNLSSHLKKLEEASFVIIEKKFVDNKPTTTVSISTVGHKAVVEYVDLLNKGIDI